LVARDGLKHRTTPAFRGHFIAFHRRHVIDVKHAVFHVPPRCFVAFQQTL